MSTARAQIVSATNGQPLDSASVEVVNSDAHYLGQGVKTDSKGKFVFTSSALDGNYLLISYAGLDSAMVDPDDYSGSDYKVIQLYPKVLNEVVVTPDKNKFPWWIVGLLILGIGAAALSKKKKRKK